MPDRDPTTVKSCIRFLMPAMLHLQYYQYMSFHNYDGRIHCKSHVYALTVQIDTETEFMKAAASIGQRCIYI
jgi:hypothetical protein